MNEIFIKKRSWEWEGKIEVRREGEREGEASEGKQEGVWRKRGGDGGRGGEGRMGREGEERKELGRQ